MLNSEGGRIISWDLYVGSLFSKFQMLVQYYDPKLLEYGGKVPKPNGMVADSISYGDKLFIWHEINSLLDENPFSVLFNTLVSKKSFNCCYPSPWDKWNCYLSFAKNF